MQRLFWLLLICCLLAPASSLAAEEATPAFRTDGGDEKLPWFQLKPGEFPPLGSAHYIGGELIALDHVNRTGILRPDRTDAQRRGDWDLPHAFTMLPYGSLRYHGAPAELKDIPLGTHLHGYFYLEEPKAKAPKAKPPANAPRLSLEAPFNRCLRLEDDFSYCQRLERNWKIEAIDRELGVLTLLGITAGQADAKPTLIQIVPSSRVWKGNGLGTLADLAVGQTMTTNLTVCTLKGPGRCKEIWLDQTSRDLATGQQLEVHRQFQREHGLPGMIEEVDNPNSIVTVHLYAGFDPKLIEAFAPNDSVTAAVAEDNLRTWDQINDRKSGPLVAVERVEPRFAGQSGYRVKFKPGLLLEGFRPQRVIRIWPSAWKVDDLPREERLYN
ncbi:hypothetical protein ETAA8_06000 [Anatilimnocola aggregata]|uniref:Uncharacterized protein n=1 Tax=Anatilimnocola aggregata TaxID=2528021 RepID=A0A517Y5L5_9BACT|nr:hypothetical protein [Anatilimnocola aggregata]QDU25531.1 hypothetical protein ETAA8_06000 [Anatilimnocola aggregata]